MTYAEAIEKIVEEAAIPDAQGWIDLETLVKVAEKLDGSQE